MPRGKKFTAEQIIGKLREAEVGLAQGKSPAKVLPPMPLNQIDPGDLPEFAVGQRRQLAPIDADALQKLRKPRESLSGLNIAAASVRNGLGITLNSGRLRTRDGLVSSR